MPGTGGTTVPGIFFVERHNFIIHWESVTGVDHGKDGRNNSSNMDTRFSSPYLLYKKEKNFDHIMNKNEIKF
jgi:hypothetical protein